MSRRYPVGSVVSYVDYNATVSDGVPGVVTGVINGPSFEYDAVPWVPVWTERDNGREPTTVWVPGPNILDAS